MLLDLWTVPSNRSLPSKQTRARWATSPLPRLYQGRQRRAIDSTASRGELLHEAPSSASDFTTCRASSRDCFLHAHWCSSRTPVGLPSNRVLGFSKFLMKGRNVSRQLRLMTAIFGVHKAAAVRCSGHCVTRSSRSCASSLLLA